MKNIKSIWIIRLAIIVAVDFSVSACLKEDILSVAEPMPQGEVIRFSIERGWDEQQELTKGESLGCGSFLSQHTLLSNDQMESIDVKAYQKSIDTWFEPQTRGSMVPANAFNEFMAFGYKTSGATTSQMFATYHQKGGAMWEKPVDVNGGDNANGYYWPGSDYTCSFFGIAMSDNKLTNESFYSNVTTNLNDSGQIVSFDYTVPIAAADQPDIMVASATNLPGDGSAGAALNFNHILTAVNIKVGTTMQNGTIESISFKNIYGKATYDIQTGIWSGLREFNQLHNYSVDLGGGFSTSSSQTNTQINAAGATFMVIPQTLSANAEIEIMFKHAGAADAISIKGSLAGTSWPQGRIVNYLVNIKPDGNLVFTSNVIAQDAHYVIVPLTIKANNLSKGWTMISDNPAVTLKSELSTLQQQGYWTVNELGTQTLTSTASGNEVKVYAFIEENLEESNRTFTLSLRNTATGDIVDTKTITQLCMSSARSERIEETSYVPWGFKWDREVVFQVTPGLSFDFQRLFGAVLFEYTANDVIEQYGASDYVSVTVGGRVFGMSYDTKVTIDYSKIAQLNGAFSTSDGHSNTNYLYNYKGVSAVSQVETYLRDQAISNNYNFNESTSGDSDGESVERFAAKSCAMKNKYFAETVTQDTGNGSVTYQVAVLSSDETSNATDSFDYLQWYLPAQDQYGLIETAEMGSDYQLNGVYWTSTAVSDDNVNSYIYTPGGTGIGIDDRMKTHLVRCMRKN